MPIKLFTVKCPEHGKMEVSAVPETSECPRTCPVQTDKGICSQPLQRIYTPISVHYNGSGFYKTDNTVSK